VEIINDLLDDKDTLGSIARSFQEELAAQRITEEEIVYITDNFIPKLKALVKQAPNSGGSATAANVAKTLDRLKPLLSVEMLTVLQAPGFNFKQAIGEPLTLLVQKAITSRVLLTPSLRLSAICWL
jgi:hypothetical protein